MRTFALFLIALLPLSLSAALQPNVIFIIADDAGYGDFSCYGQKHFKTPRIDRMAAEGMKFTQHYAGSTVCAPTRCSLMSGLHTGHCYVRGNREIQPVGQHPIPADMVTVAEVFKDAGYATGAFGKWGLGFPGSEGDPVNQGFDRFYGYNCQRNAHTYYPTWLYDGLKKIELDGKTYSDYQIMDECIGWLKAQQDKPFFLFVPTTIPHAAMHVPDSYRAPYEEQFSEYKDVVGRYSGPQVKNPVAAFAGMMARLDESVGRILDTVEDMGVAGNTLVLFTSDNGPHKEGGHKPDVFDSNGPLNGYKRNLTEGGIRVPLIAWWPGKVKPGSTSDHISAHWDFMPTVCELIGAPLPGRTDGISYLPTLLGQSQRPHEYLYWEFHAQGGKKAARMGDWKAVQRNVGKQPDGPIMLFNLANDLGETTDLAEKHPDIVSRMRAIFKEAHEPSEHFQWGVRKPKNKK